MCNVPEKRPFLTEEACMIAIRMEGKYGLTAPYLCRNNGGHYHMTRDKVTVKRYYGHRERDRRTSK